MSPFPSVPLGDMVLNVVSWTPESDRPDGSFTYIDLSSVDLNSKTITRTRVLPCVDAPSRARQIVNSGDVLVSTVRPNLNGVACVPAELDSATASTGFCVLRPQPNKLDGGYLFHWARSPQFVGEMVRMATGASYPAVSDRIILASKVPLPPLSVQRQIAEMLDRADALRAKRRAALAQLNTVIQSTFLHMFGDPTTNPKGWEIVALGDHTSKIGSGATPLGGEASYKGTGIALIRSMNVHDGAFSRDGLAFIDEQQAVRLNNVIVEADDVLLNITGASVARVCRVPADILPSRVNQHVTIIRPAGTLNASFLEHCLLCSSTKTRLLKIAHAGATREAITKSEIAQFEIICPPRDLQKKFADIVAVRERTQRGFQDSLTEFDNLFASLQHRAFRGEL